MRSISSAIISFICWYIATHMNKEKFIMMGLFVCISLIMLLVAFVLMIFGL